MKNRLITSISVLLFLIPCAHASVDDDLAEASRFVAQQKAEESQRAIAALVAPSPSELLKLPRFYKKGDLWVVAISHMSYGFMRKMDTGTDDKVLNLDPEYYEFRVLDASSSKATIEVKPVSATGEVETKAKVQRVLFQISSDLEIISKTYYRRGAKLAASSTNTNPSNVFTGFDPVPIVLPEFDRAKTGSMLDLQSMMPQTLTEAASRHPIDPAKTIRFKQVDLFGRDVRIDWQRGDLWPARIQSMSGYALLVKQELAQ